MDGEDVGEFPVVALGPEVAVGLCVDQLHGDADTAARLAHAALDDVLDAKLLGDLLRVDRLALVNERRVSRDNEQLAETRQLSENILGDAVGEEFLLGLAAHVDERQDGDRWLVANRRTEHGSRFCVRSPQSRRGLRR